MSLIIFSLWWLHYVHHRIVCVFFFCFFGTLHFCCRCWKRDAVFLCSIQFQILFRDILRRHNFFLTIKNRNDVDFFFLRYLFNSFITVFYTLFLPFSKRLMSAATDLLCQNWYARLESENCDFLHCILWGQIHFCVNVNARTTNDFIVNGMPTSEWQSENGQTTLDLLNFHVKHA